MVRCRQPRCSLIPKPVALSFNRKDGADYTFELTLKMLGVVNPVLSVDIEAFENGWSLLRNTSTFV